MTTLTAGCILGVGDGPPPLLDRLPRDLTSSETRAVAANNGLSFALLARAVTDRPNHNVFLSPLSASMVLGMAMNGARGPTREAIARTIGFEAVAQSEINEAFRGLRQLILDLDDRTEIRLANSLSTDQRFSLKPAFVADTKTIFDAEVRALDFRAPNAPTVINAWAKEKTAGRIPTIIESIGPDEVMFILNAMYFKGRWRDEFDPSRTQPTTFHARGGAQQVPFINRATARPHARTVERETIDLWYRNGAYSMTIVLPAPGFDIDAMIGQFTAEHWRALVDGLQSQEVALSMPKFTFEATRDLRADLEALGMQDAFGGVADYSGIADGGAALNSVSQSTFVEVNEEGTVAAVVTKGGIAVVDGPAPMVVDRPFLFVIRERLSGTILFLGRVVKISGHG